MVGLSAPIRAACADLAGHGYLAVAPDLHEGEITINADEATGSSRALISSSIRICSVPDSKAGEGVELALEQRIVGDLDDQSRQDHILFYLVLGRPRGNRAPGPYVSDRDHRSGSISLLIRRFHR